MSQGKAEFARILGQGNPVKEMAEKVQQNWVDKILKFARYQHGSKDTLDLMNDGISDNPSKTDGMIIMLTYSSI